jgi:hypothetical protein
LRLTQSETLIKGEIKMNYVETRKAFNELSNNGKFIINEYRLCLLKDDKEGLALWRKYAEGECITHLLPTLVTLPRSNRKIVSY